MTDPKSRRAFLRDTGIGALGFWVGGSLLQLTPAQARAEQVPFRVLEAGHVRALEAFAEVLLPGSAAAGIAHFIDHQLAAPAGEQLLMIRYLGVEPPFQPFYAGGLAALDAVANSRSGGGFADLETDARQSLAAEAAQGEPGGWQGPPAAFFTFVVRSDALDVVYGTKAGMESLGIPYMAHIEPPSRWGE